MESLPNLVAGLQSSPATRPPSLPDEFLAAIPEIQRATVLSTMHSGVSFADAEDATQDALVSMYLALQRGDTISTPRAWARVVARRAAWRLASRQGRERLTANEDLAVLAGDADNHEKMADDIAERVQVLDWIRQLPADHQNIIALVGDGYSPSEIAEQLGLSTAVVRVRLKNAREKLRKAFVTQLEADRRAERAEQPATAARSRQVSRPRPADASSAEEVTHLRALADLPPRQQEVLRLSRRGYKPAQIARLLGLSPNTVRVNLYHARNRMRQTLELLSGEETRVAVSSPPGPLPVATPQLP
jgi:RNA polymerase sigma factor (sigma-70 family)